MEITNIPKVFVAAMEVLSPVIVGPVLGQAVFTSETPAFSYPPASRTNISARPPGAAHVLSYDEVALYSASRDLG